MYLYDKLEYKKEKFAFGLK